MKILLISLALLASAVLFIFCKSTKHTVDNLPAKQMLWGAGGGFTGKETSFAMLENGQIFKFVGISGEKMEISATKAKTAKAMFSSAETLELGKIEFNAPGNMYYFLEIKDGDKSHRITWGDDKSPVEQKVKDFYTVLQGLTREGSK